LAAAPDGAAAWTALGSVLQRKGESDAAIDALRRSIALEPDAASAHEALGVAYAASRRSDDGIEQLRFAVALAPDGGETRASLIDALQAAGRDAEAIALCREGLVLAPDAPPLLSAAAWILATSTDASLRNGTEALRLAERAASSAGTHTVVAFDALAAAYAELGRFDEAVRTSSALVDALTKGGQDSMAAVVETHRATYASGRPWRSVSKIDRP
jgi:tetratricopeptide (TPR) repeat protein